MSRSHGQARRESRSPVLDTGVELHAASATIVAVAARIMVAPAQVPHRLRLWPDPTVRSARIPAISAIIKHHCMEQTAMGSVSDRAGCPMDGERGRAGAFSRGARGGTPRKKGAFSRGARGGNPSQKIDRVAKQKRRIETARASLLPVGLSGSGPQLFGTPWQAQRRRLFLAVPSVESRGSTVLHLAVQTTNTPAAGGDEKEGKEGMHQAGQPCGQHGCPKSHGLDEVLRVGFPDFSQMFGQWIHHFTTRTPHATPKVFRRLEPYPIYGRKLFQNLRVQGPNVESHYHNSPSRELRGA